MRAIFTNRRHGQSAIVTAVLTTLAVAACGSNTSSQQGGAYANKAANCTGTSINIGTNGDAQNINPILAVDLDGRWRTDLMFDPLINVNPQTLLPAPGLATSWEASADGRIYTFHLRKNVKFHNGQAFSAEDVKFTVMQMLAPDYTGSYRNDWTRLSGAADVVAGKATSLTGLQVVDPQTIKMTLDEPYAGFLTVVVRQLKPLPSEVLATGGPLTRSSPFSLHPIGTGPYKFDSWVKGSSFSAVANADYWGGVPCMKKITQTVIPDMNTLVSALESGEIDASIIPPPGQLDRLRRNPALKVYAMPPLTPEGLYFNLRHEPWKSNVKLRQAIAFGIDFKAFAKEFMAGTSDSPASFLSPASWAYNKSALPPQYDPQKAAQLLTEAGYPGGKGLTLELSTNAGNLFRAQEQTYIQAQLAKLGVTVNLKSYEWGKFIGGVKQGSFDVAAMNGGDNAGIPDPTAIDPTYKTGGAVNYGGYSNPKVDQLLTKAAVIKDVAQRKKLYDEAQEILSADLPFLPTFWRPNSLVVKTKEKGVAPSVIGAYWNIKDWSNK